MGGWVIESVEDASDLAGLVGGAVEERWVGGWDPNPTWVDG